MCSGWWQSTLQRDRDAPLGNLAGTSEPSLSSVPILGVMWHPRRVGDGRIVPVLPSLSPFFLHQLNSSSKILC